MTYVLHFFNLRLWLRSTAEGRSFSGPNIWLRPKVKIAPTVQHWSLQKCPKSVQKVSKRVSKVFKSVQTCLKSVQRCQKKEQKYAYIIYEWSTGWKKNTEIPRFHLLPWMPPSDETPKGAIFLHIWMVAFCLLQAFSDTFLEFLPQDQCKFLFFFFFAIFRQYNMIQGQRLNFHSSANT